MNLHQCKCLAESVTYSPAIWSNPMTTPEVQHGKRNQ